MTKNCSPPCFSRAPPSDSLLRMVLGDEAALLPLGILQNTTSCIQKVVEDGPAKVSHHELLGKKEIGVIGAVEASTPPSTNFNATMVQTVYLKTMGTTRKSKKCDGIDEISPCAADEAQQTSSVRGSAPSGSSDIDLDQQDAAHSRSAALEIQKEEDAELARRLAEEGEWVS